MKKVMVVLCLVVLLLAGCEGSGTSSGSSGRCSGEGAPLPGQCGWVDSLAGSQNYDACMNSSRVPSGFICHEADATEY
jgi:hypothetical protein